MVRVKEKKICLILQDELDMFCVFQNTPETLPKIEEKFEEF